MVDEPRAALIGRDVLSAGGSAADAAVAAYFTMAVTMPGGASLGGGGVCLVHDRANNRVEVVEFLTGLASNGAGNARVAIPGNVRGMALLQARYGRLNWSDLLVPAENFARGGHAISRAFASDLVGAAASLRGDREASRLLGLEAGEITEGRIIRQIELAAVLTVVRTRGAGEFYNGQLSRQIVAAIQQTGGAITADDLREYRPKLMPPIQMELGNERIYFPSAPAQGGVIAGQIWAAGIDDDRYSDGDAGQRAHFIAEVGARAYAADSIASAPPESLVAAPVIGKLVAGHDRSRHTPLANGGAVISDSAASGRHDGVSLVTVDRQGQAVACAFTLNRPFGAEKIAPGTGILLAAPDAGPRASLPSAVMVANPISAQLFFGAAISGGSPATLAAIALETLDVGRDIGVAVTQPRAYNTGRPDTLIAEPGLSQAVQDFLAKAGYTVQFQEGLGRVNGFRCPRGLPREPNCQFVSEPRAHGLAVSADEK